MRHHGAVAAPASPLHPDGGAARGAPVRFVSGLAFLFVLAGVGGAQTAPDSAGAKADSAVLIAPVKVDASPSELDRVGFSARKRSSSGQFLVRAEIERRQPSRVSSIFRSVPGFRVATANSRSRVQGTRGGGCMTYFIDNARFAPVLGTDIDDAIAVSEVAAIEIYTVATTPSEYATADRGLCSTVVMWTRARIEDRRPTSGRSP